jgi:hypothetical protein
MLRGTKASQTMINHPNRSKKKPAPLLVKKEADLPALIVTGARTLSVRAGTRFAAHTYAKQTPVKMPDELCAGADYVVIAAARPKAVRALSIPAGLDVLGGFHFAPGGNAIARTGGGTTPEINPCSLWDVDFRPSCPDPRGMTLVTTPHGKFWCDIYLTGVDHLKNGTSAYDVTIADGKDRPIDPATGAPFARFDYATAVAVMKHHGKGLLGLDEYVHAFFGVTERSAVGKDPVKTGLDAARTSRFGVMQATGNLWVWGHDGDPDQPRASLFGGNWWYDGVAGSRYAYVACNWPGDSCDGLGARGRSDHLQPVRRRGSDGVAPRAASRGGR